jgi:uncharacterized protein YecE (DUF72 family)
VRTLAGRLPHGVRFGTSTWSFPGWQGIVYGGDYDETKLSREGLSAYAHHPLLRSVGVDRSYYRPLDDKTLLRMASAVPTDFKFLLKAHAALMLPKSARRPDYLAGVSDVFLDSTYASRNVIEPALRQLGEKLGVILFQFSPLGDRVLRYRKELLERLESFLTALPSEAQYAVEWRDATLLGPDLADVLARCKVAHGYAGHPRMPQIDEQVSFDRGEGPLVIRWLLRRDRVYEDARMTYAPFDRLLEPDADSRRGILSLLHGAVGQGREAIVIVNNKAEGSAPLSVLQLAREWSSVG